MPKRRRLVCAAIFLSVLLLSCVLFELSLRRWWPQEPIVGGDPRIRDAEMGFIYSPNSLRIYRLPQRTVSSQMNQDGLRDSAVHPIPKPAHLFRVLLVGDSFTFGTANQYNEIWPVLLERRVAEQGYRVDVVNAGVEEFDTHSELRMMQRLMPKYQPDLVLMAFLPNDIFTNEPLERAAKDAAGPPAPPEVLRAGIGVSDLQIRYFFQRRLLENDYIYTRVYWMTSRKQYFMEKQTGHAATQYEVTRDLLLRSQEYATSQHSQFAVVSIPQCFQVLAKARGIRLTGLSADSVDRRMGEFAARQGFPWLPALETMAQHYRESRQELYWREDGHLTPLGNRVLADWLSQQFIRIYGAEVTRFTAER